MNSRLLDCGGRRGNPSWVCHMLILNIYIQYVLFIILFLETCLCKNSKKKLVSPNLIWHLPLPFWYKSYWWRAPMWHIQSHFDILLSCQLHIVPSTTMTIRYPILDGLWLKDFLYIKMRLWSYTAFKNALLVPQYYHLPRCFSYNVRITACFGTLLWYRCQRTLLESVSSFSYPTTKSQGTQKLWEQM